MAGEGGDGGRGREESRIVHECDVVVCVCEGEEYPIWRIGCEGDFGTLRLSVVVAQARCWR